MLTSFVGGAMMTGQGAEFVGRRVLVAGSASDLDMALTEALGALSANVVVERAATIAAPAGCSGRYDDVFALTQGAVRSLGGLDAVISMVELDRAALAEAIARDKVESYCTDTLAGPLAAIRVALNRMETTWVEGALVAVLVIPAGLSVGASLVARIARSMLADMVRHEAMRAAPFGISVRAVIVDQAVTDDAAAAVSAILSAISLAAANLTGVAVEVDGCY